MDANESTRGLGEKARESASVGESHGMAYLSGPMSGIKDDNYPAFDAAAVALRALGWAIVNPTENTPPADPTWENWMRVAVKSMMDCDTIIMLPGWLDSRGACVELDLAHRLGFEVLYYADVARGAV